MTTLRKRLIKAAKEARAIARGDAERSTYRVHLPAKVDVRAIRTKLGLRQNSTTSLEAVERALASFVARRPRVLTPRANAFESLTRRADPWSPSPRPRLISAAR